MVTHRRNLLVPALGAALLILLAFLTTGGDPSQLATGWVDLILILAGGGAAAILIIRGRRGDGALTFWLFAAVAALTALSIAWSVAPDQSWEESGQTVAYLAAFGIGLVLARSASGTSRGGVIAVALATICICIWALAVKVFDLNLYGQPDYGRLLAPFGYWNATGLTGALALPTLTWIAARSEGSRLGRGLGAAGIMLAVTVVALSYSRSAVAAALIGAIVPLFLIRSRRRAVLMLALGLAGAVPVCLYALSDHDISSDTSSSIYGGTITHLNRGGAELLLGLIIVVVAVLLTSAGALTAAWIDTHPQPAERLRVVDRLLVAAAVAVPVVIVLWLVLNARGPFGEISHLWKALTSVNGAPVGDNAGRLTSVANSRSAYWRQAISVGDHHLLAGAGADTFFPAHLRYSTATLTQPGLDVKHTHSYVLDAFASLGLAGVLLNLALFISWCADAGRSVRRRLSVAAGEIDARWALIGVVSAFGVSSALDWTWYYAGVTVPALLAAGWITGVGARPRSTRAQLGPAGPDRPAGAPSRPLSARPGAIIVLTILAVITLAIGWESLQPMRSIQSDNASLSAEVDGRPGPALADARAAVSQDPLSAVALSRLATVERALGDQPGSRAELIKATHVQPENPQSFAALGSYLLCRGDDAAALAPLERANLLDITDSLSQAEMLASARARQLPSQFCGSTT